VDVIEGAGRYTDPGREPNHYVEQLRVADLSVGSYSIPAGGVDDQTPHTEDEVYVVAAGRARLTSASGDAPVGPGDVIFVPAGEAHRFVEVEEDLALLVVFAPAEGSRAGT
jgi:mannose-6-phosphate isomerase-like protein (cupin superfamily)